MFNIAESNFYINFSSENDYIKYLKDKIDGLTNINSTNDFYNAVYFCLCFLNNGLNNVHSYLNNYELEILNYVLIETKLTLNDFKNVLNLINIKLNEPKSENIMYELLQQ